MNRDIKEVAKWARDQGWTVEDDASGYTRFYSPAGAYVVRYPATPSNARRRMAEVITAIRREGLQWPPPSKGEQRAHRRKGGQ